MRKARLAYVLCAGIGKRLRPLTLHYPKALLPVGGTPMVFHVLDALRLHGVRRFLVNLHAHPAVLRRALREYGRRQGVGFIFLYEKTLLDTGGALRNAIRHLTEPFWLVNCDFLPQKFSFDVMERAHIRNGSAATLAVRPMRGNEPFNPVGVDGRGQLVRVSKVFGRGGRDCVFLGVHRLEPEALQFLEGRKKFPVFSGLYRRMIKSGRPIHAFSAGGRGRPRGRPPIDPDMGTLEGYYNANFSQV